MESACDYALKLLYEKIAFEKELKYIYIIKKNEKKTTNECVT